jgi:hypothetical protein
VLKRDLDSLPHMRTSTTISVHAKATSTTESRTSVSGGLPDRRPRNSGALAKGSHKRRSTLFDQQSRPWARRDAVCTPHHTPGLIASVICTKLHKSPGGREKNNRLAIGHLETSGLADWLPRTAPAPGCMDRVALTWAYARYGLTLSLLRGSGPRITRFEREAGLRVVISSIWL